MTWSLKLLFLAAVAGVLVMLFMGIYRGGGPEDIFVQSHTTQDKGFKPLAKKLEVANEGFKKAEQELKSFKLDTTYETMVIIPAGEFIIGARDGGYDEQPERRVSLAGYYIDRYEVTFAQYYNFVAATGHRKPRLVAYLGNVETEDLPLFMKPLNPVVGVSWGDAVDYCQWQGKRLPTEAEWEKAARGGDGRKWPWGNDENPSYANLSGEEDGFRYTAPVDQFKQDKSSYGVFDMAGNVMEWVSDWYQEDYYKILPVSNPTGPLAGGYRVIRGASWNDSIDHARVTARFKMFPEYPDVTTGIIIGYRDVTIGFRCVKSI